MRQRRTDAPCRDCEHAAGGRLLPANVAAAGLWLATHAGRGTGNVAVVRYGDPQVEQRIDLSQNADYDIDTGTYTVHLHVENGGIAFVNSPCPDHLCEGFGILLNAIFSEKFKRNSALIFTKNQCRICAEIGRLRSVCSHENGL